MAAVIDSDTESACPHGPVQAPRSAASGARPAGIRVRPRVWAVLLAGGTVLGGCATATRDLPTTVTGPDSGSTVVAPTRGGLSGPLEMDEIVAAAVALLGAPYRYAGGDPSGFDCSGLTSYLYGRTGVELPRTAADQAEVGSRVALDELAPGDLVFFAESNRKPHHVGLVVSDPGEALTMIHASSSSGVVRTDVTASEYWLRRLRFGRRPAP